MFEYHSNGFEMAVRWRDYPLSTVQVDYHLLKARFNNGTSHIVARLLSSLSSVCLVTPARLTSKCNTRRTLFQLTTGETLEFVATSELRLRFFPKRRSTFLSKFDGRTAMQDSTSRGSPQSDAMVYPQESRPQYYGKEDEILGRELRDKNDIEIQTLSLHDEKEEAAAGNVTLKDRLKHFTFAWYACTMSTCGVAFVLFVIPSRFDGLTKLGTGIFVFNLLLFTAFTITMCVRFYVHPGTFTHSMTNPHEGFFFATFWLSLATMITNTTAYGIPNAGP
jgi:hypothetical protein